MHTHYSEFRGLASYYGKTVGREDTGKMGEACDRTRRKVRWMVMYICMIIIQRWKNETGIERKNQKKRRGY